ncbi:hypothetical protein vBCtySFA67_00077 [Clostridium phage vB_CtyS-FA67]|nr:hypothetical protein vBCtySFA67_00077 [Clostridium phage vB_CtyS-FA67]WMU08183.1 hypothetical protein vBCtySFA70_00079 [Clostridium phage vB_CtyS-FA70]
MIKTIQDKSAELVQNEVFTSQTNLVECLLNEGIFDYGEIKNPCTDNSEKIAELIDRQISCDIEDPKYSELEDKINDLEAEQEEPRDIFEWWAVSDWLARKLEEAGEPILVNAYGTWWGRTCCGQAIKMDNVIQCIVE